MFPDAEGPGARSRSSMIAELRRLQGFDLGPAPTSDEAAGPEECCDLCGATIPPDHRHLLHLETRRIVCSCETCRALLSGDTPYRPTGTRVLWLPELDLSDEVWASLAIPIGLACLYRDGRAGELVALYPSAAGTTRSELDLTAWERIVAANPVLDDLEDDVEALVIDRLGEERRYAVAPIDECFRLAGMIRLAWAGISGGDAVRDAVDAFFAELHLRVAT